MFSLVTELRRAASAGQAHQHVGRLELFLALEDRISRALAENASQVLSFDVMPNLQAHIDGSLADREVLAQRQDETAAIGTQREGILAKSKGRQRWLLDCIV